MSDENNFPRGKCPTTRIMTMPKDTNALGDIFGGWLVSQMDIAGAVAAYEKANGRCVTVALDSIQFHQPVFVGDVISCFTEIVKIGNTSITVKIEVYSERPGVCVKVTEGVAVYVAIGDDRRPRPVPKE